MPNTPNVCLRCGETEKGLRKQSFCKRCKNNQGSPSLIHHPIPSLRMVDNPWSRHTTLFDYNEEEEGRINCSGEDGFWKKMDSLFDKKLNNFEKKVFQEIKKITDPMKNEMETIKKENKLLKVEMQLLKTKQKTNEENNSSLKNVVVKQQMSITQMDGDKRQKNVIVRGLPENDIIENEDIYHNDIDKVKNLLSKIDVALPNGSQVERLGKQSVNYNRVTKIILNDKSERDNILENAKKLKHVEDPWKNIYLKKDLHPAILEEDKRLNKKKKDLKKEQVNNGKEVIIERGKLKVDGIIVDQNLFFH